MHFAHGAVFVVGAYIAYALLGLPFWLAIIIAIIASAVLGVIIDQNFIINFIAFIFKKIKTWQSNAGCC